MTSRAIGTILLLMVAFSSAVQADEASLVAKVEDEKLAYRGRLLELRKDVVALLDQREQKARARGDSAEIDSVAKARLRFQTKHLIPSDFPEAIRKRHESSIVRLTKAFESGEKAAIKEKLDYVAMRLSEERKAFDAEVHSVLILTNELPSQIKVYNDWFSRDGRSLIGQQLGGNITFGGTEYKEALLAHPGPRDYSEITFRLEDSWETFTCRVGVPRATNEPKNRQVGSALTFEVMSDSSSLWRSRPSQDIDKLQQCRIDFPESSKIVLRAHCADDYSLARAVWLEPRLSALRFPPPKEPASSAPDQK